MGMIDKEDAIKAVCEACYMYKYIGEHYKDCKYYPCDDVVALEAVSEAPKPTGDLISRADAIEAICNKCGGCDDNHDECWEITALKALPSAEAAPTIDESDVLRTDIGQGGGDCIKATMSDLISRADAIEAICMNDCGGCRPNECGAYLDKSCDVVKVISALPSAEQVTGKLKNPCDSLLTDDSEADKEQKSKLESADDTFCKSQLITCNRVKECNGVCPFEDALKHADKMQTMDEQHTVDHDRDWIIGCIEHDGFIHTHRFDKANQIILDALSAEAVQGWIPCSEMLPKVGENVLFTTDIYGGYVAEGDRRADGKWWQYRWNALLQNDEVTAWMPLPTPYKGGDDK